MEFSGYRRKDGRVGVRNHVLVMSSVSCANGVVEAIGRALPEVVVITHPYGCGYGPEDINVSASAPSSGTGSWQVYVTDSQDQAFEDMCAVAAAV